MYMHYTHGHTEKRYGLLLSGNSQVRRTLVLVARLTEKFLGTSVEHKTKYRISFNEAFY